MKRNAAIAVAIGIILYAALMSFSIMAAKGQLDAGSYQEGWLESIASLFAWFMPGLVAGFLSHGKPFIVGSFLGLMIMVFDFAAAVVIFGWDWALALIGLFPASQLFLLMSAVVFAYAGWKIQEIATQGPPKNVA